MTARRRRATAAGLLSVALLAGACSSKDDDRPEASSASSTTSTTDATGDATGDATPSAEEPAEGAPTTLMADRLASVTTEPPAPRVALEVEIGGTVSGKATGDVTARCVRGSGYLDVDVIAERPLPLGQYGITSLVFSAPGYRGPGRYDASRADDEEWAVALVDLETDEPLEFYSPADGVGGSVTIDAGGKAGSFDIRGLVDNEERSVTVTGRFTCGAVEG